MKIRAIGALIPVKIRATEYRGLIPVRIRAIKALIPVKIIYG